GAVRPHDRVALAAADRDRQVVDDRLRTVAGGETVGRKGDRSGARTSVELEVRERLIGLGTLQLIEPAEHLPARFRLLRFLTGEIATNEILRLLDQLLL